MEKHTVDVSGQLCVVRVHQLAKNVWIAAGEFLGGHLKTTGRTAGKAIRAWKKTAAAKPRNVANSSVAITQSD